jgi:hypothetical protein
MKRRGVIRQASRPEDLGINNFTSRQEQLDEREIHLPAAPGTCRLQLFNLVGIEQRPTL